MPPNIQEFPCIATSDFIIVDCLAHNTSGCVLSVLWEEKHAIVKFSLNPQEIWIHLQLQEEPGVIDVWAKVKDSVFGEGLLMPRASVDLQTEIERGTRILPQQLAPVARALLRMHARGWLHRDLHPGNIVFHDNTWKLIDFGLSHPYHGGFCCPQQSHAVIRFASLRQLANEIEYPSDDWYSFGLVALSALHGKWPWSGLQEPQVLLQKIKNPFSPFGDCASQKYLQYLGELSPTDEEAVMEILKEMTFSMCSCNF